MTITLAQPAAANHSSTQVTSLTVTLAAPATAHNCLVACIGGHNTNTVTGVTSSGSPDHWAAGAASDAGAVTSEIWIDPDCAGGNTTVTAQTTVNGLLIVQVFEFSGVATSAALDVTAPGGLSLAPLSSWSSGSTGTALAGDVVVGSCCGFAGSPYTLNGPPSPWTTEAPVTTSLSGIYTRLVAGYQVLSGAGAAAFSGTTTGASQSYGAVALALKSATGGSGSSGSFLPFFA